MSIANRISETLRMYGMVLPTPVRAVLQEIGAELVALRAEVEQLKGEHGKAN